MIFLVKSLNMILKTNAFLKTIVTDEHNSNYYRQCTQIRHEYHVLQQLEP